MQIRKVLISSCGCMQQADICSDDDCDIDREFVNHGFNLSDAAIDALCALSREHPDDPFPFPQPTVCPMGSGRELFSLAEIARWHQKRVEAVVALAQGALNDVIHELEMTWLGRLAILEKALDVKLVNLDVHEEDEEDAV